MNKAGEIMQGRLRLIAAHRPSVPIEDRLECLLWSWPVYSIIDKHRKIPLLWTGPGDDKTQVRRAAIMEELETFEELLYPIEKPSISSPGMLDNPELLEMCQELCRELRTLPGLRVDDPGDDILWLTTIYEFLYGDGERDFRRELQKEVVVHRNTRERRQICNIGERARDEAYRSIKVKRAIKVTLYTKDEAKRFSSALRAFLKHQEFVEAQFHLPPLVFTGDAPVHNAYARYHHTSTAFYRAYQDLVALAPGALFHCDYIAQLVAEERDRLPTAGNPSLQWVTDANQALIGIKLKPKLKPRDHLDLLQAWGLKQITDK